LKGEELVLIKLKYGKKINYSSDSLEKKKKRKNSCSSGIPDIVSSPFIARNSFGWFGIRGFKNLKGIFRPEKKAEGCDVHKCY